MPSSARIHEIGGHWSSGQAQSNPLVTIRRDIDRSPRSQGPAELLDRVIEVLEAEWRVAECNAAIERQRQLIEQLADEGDDIGSAQIVFDSLHISLHLHLQVRHRLGALNAKPAEATKLGLAEAESQQHVA